MGELDRLHTLLQEATTRETSIKADLTSARSEAGQFRAQVEALNARLAAAEKDAITFKDKIVSKKSGKGDRRREMR